MFEETSLLLWMKTGWEIPIPTDTVYRINRSHTVFVGKTGNEKPTPYFRQEREQNQLRDFANRIHGSRIWVGKFPTIFLYSRAGPLNVWITDWCSPAHSRPLVAGPLNVRIWTCELKTTCVTVVGLWLLAGDLWLTGCGLVAACCCLLACLFTCTIFFNLNCCLLAYCELWTIVFLPVSLLLHMVAIVASSSLF